MTTTVLSDPSAKDLHVWAPEAEGPWPVIYAIPGSGGEAEGDLDILASELASRGIVVLATDWKTGNEDVQKAHAECGYRFARTVAEDLGGDLTQPVTMLGFSLGGPVAVGHGVDDKQYDAGWEPTYYGASGPCFPDASLDRPDVIVAIAGPFVDVGFPREIQNWGNPDAVIALIAGADDVHAQTSQSEMTLDLLEQHGYTASLVEIPNADHAEVVFHTFGEEVLPRDSEIGQETVRVVLDVIEQARS